MDLHFTRSFLSSYRKTEILSKITNQTEKQMHHIKGAFRSLSTIYDEAIPKYG